MQWEKAQISMGMIRSIREDIRSVFERDPAATSLAMVLLCYPGLHALWFYRGQSLAVEKESPPACTLPQPGGAASDGNRNSSCRAHWLPSLH